MKTTFTVTETFTVTANTIGEVQTAVSNGDYSDVNADFDKSYKVTIEPNI